VRRLEATITLEYSDEKTAEAVANAVSPDNFKTPIELRVRTAREAKRVVTKIGCESKIATFIATIDDLLFCASTAEKTLQTIKSNQKLNHR
jgi:cell fate regulator YaaT (PSP1 superfamily)